MSSRHRPTLLGVIGTAVAAVLLVSACGGNDDEAEPTTTTAADAGTTTEQVSTTSAAPACPPVSVPDAARELTSLSGDLDGDGAADTLQSYLLGEDEWHLQVVLAGDGGADLMIPGYGAAVGVLGGADVDGDGTDELWARTGSGASATIIGLVRLVGCDLVRASFANGQPADLPVGGSVGTTSGVECTAADGDGPARLRAHLATLTGESTYEVITTTYILEGTTLTETGTVTTTVDTSDDDFPRYTSFTCGDLFV